jgi:predicted RNase H-like HicB family nuclease
MEYLVIFEEDGKSIGAYVLDLPGCVAIGETRDEANQRTREAIELHIQSLREHGEPVPQPHLSVEIIAVSKAG